MSNTNYLFNQMSITKDLLITGKTTITSTLTVLGLASMSSILSVVGATTFGSSVNITGLLNINTLSIGGSSTFNGITTVASSLNINGITTFNSNIQVGGNVTIDKQLRIASGLLVTGGGANITGDLVLSGNFIQYGSSVQLNITELTVDDTVIEIGKNNPNDLVPMGIYMHYNSGLHVGIVRKPTDDGFYLLSSQTDVSTPDYSKLNNLYIKNLHGSSAGLTDVSATTLDLSTSLTVPSGNITNLSSTTIYANNGTFAGELTVNSLNVITNGTIANITVSNLTIMSSATVKDLTVTGNLIASTLNVSGNATISSALVTYMFLESKLIIFGDLEVSGTITNTSLSTGSVNLESGLLVSGTVTIGSNLDVSGTVIVRSGLIITGDLTLHSNLSIQKDNAIYFGDNTSLGSWRIRLNSTTATFNNSTLSFFDMVLERTIQYDSTTYGWIPVQTYPGSSDSRIPNYDEGLTQFLDSTVPKPEGELRGYYVRNFGQNRYLLYIGTDISTTVNNSHTSYTGGYALRNCIGINIESVYDEYFNPLGNVGGYVPRAINMNVDGADITNTTFLTVIGGDSAFTTGGENGHNALSVNGSVYFGRFSGTNILRWRRINDPTTSSIVLEKSDGSVWTEALKFTKGVAGTYSEPRIFSPDVQGGPEDFVVNSNRRYSIFVNSTGGADGAVLFNKNNLSNNNIMAEVNGDLTVRPAKISFVDNVYSPTYEWVMEYETGTGDFIVKKVGTGIISRTNLPGTGSGTLVLGGESALGSRDYVIYANSSTNVLDTGKALFVNKFATGNTGFNTTNPETTLDINGYLKVEKRLYLGAYTANSWYFESSSGALSLYYLDNDELPVLSMSWSSP